MSKKILNYINGEWCTPSNHEFYDKISPVDGATLAQVARSNTNDANQAVEVAHKSQKIWAQTPAVRRGEILFELVKSMELRKIEIAHVVAKETGKSIKDALGETGAAISQGYYMAGEGARLFGRTTGSGMENRMAMITREPVGVAALIVAFNTPIANIAWKVFPALICGNGVVLKASEDTPLTAQIFSEIANESQLPKGIFNILYGIGKEAGAALVENSKVDLVSFTGSSHVGRQIAQESGKRLAKTFLELGGKNPMVIFEDADLENAVKWAALSSFSNAGQRCAASSRILIHESIYAKFKAAFAEKTKSLKVGPLDEDDLGPVINQRQLLNIETAIKSAQARGAIIVAGGSRLQGGKYDGGCFMAPTIVEGLGPDDAFSCEELFGPVTQLFSFKNFDEAMTMANNSIYGLTSAIHTRDYNRAMEFSKKVQAGVCSINAGTHGSEPHMPFGGVKQSGAGGREPGPEALDVYTQLKVTYHNINPGLVN